MHVHPQGLRRVPAQGSLEHPVLDLGQLAQRMAAVVIWDRTLSRPLVIGGPGGGLFSSLLGEAASRLTGAILDKQLLQQLQVESDAAPAPLAEDS